MVKEGRQGDGPVVYWMSRDQRAHDNHALRLAQQRATDLHRPLVVAFALASDFRGAGARHYSFMLRSLAQVAEELAERGIGFRLLTGGAAALPPFLRLVDAAVLVEDFDPLNIKVEWKRLVRGAITCPAWEVDAHNIVPCWLASGKQEWAARTFRPKLRSMLPRFLVPMPEVADHPFGWDGPSSTVDADALMKELNIDRDTPEVELVPGRAAAGATARQFIRYRLEHYPEDRNDPTLNALSGLSTYLHFGTVSPQRIALMVQSSEAPDGAKDAFLEELIVRRELSDNFCHYRVDHDRFEALPEWARRTLDKHAGDVREHIYSDEELEAGETADELWNAAQMQMVREGKMHGYLRMYWGKKVLEWTPAPRRAMETLIRQNDRYEMDGRDPNGYVGILWCLGLHDRPWRERPIFGTVRYMSEAGMERKFDVDAYIRRHRRR